MNTTNLLKLAAFLDTVPCEQFDFGIWASSTTLGCGTTACALGWASAIPEFGIALRPTESSSPVPHLATDPSPPSLGYSYITVVREVFGLSEEHADWIFVPADTTVSRFDGDLCPDEHAGVADVADQIRAFVAAMS